MGTIPVGKTILHSYGFALGRYPALFGITWLPLLVSSLLSYSMRAQILAGIATAGGGGVFAMPAHFQRTNLLIQLVGLVVLAIISVGITKEALGLRTGQKFVYAGFGAAELRVIVGYFALLLLGLVFIIGLSLGVTILALIAGFVAGGATIGSKAIVALTIGAMALAAWLALVYIFIRLTFLFLPATVAEQRIGILRSWELTQGNFWRIFAIGFVVLLPLIILSIGIGIALLGPGYVDFVMHHAHEPDAVRTYVAQRMAMFAGMLPLLLLIGFFVNPIIYGLMIAPASFAYRALIPLPVSDVPVESAPVSGVPMPDLRAGELPQPIEDIVNPPDSSGGA